MSVLVNFDCGIQVKWKETDKINMKKKIYAAIALTMFLSWIFIMVNNSYNTAFFTDTPQQIDDYGEENEELPQAAAMEVVIEDDSQAVSEAAAEAERDSYKVLGTYNMEELIAEAYRLELLDYDEDFERLQVDFTGVYKEDGKTVLRGGASALYQVSGKEYSIEWETDTKTYESSAKAYLADFDIHPLYAAFLRNEISVGNPYVSEGPGAKLGFFDDREYETDNFRKRFSLVDVNNDGVLEFAFEMYDSPSKLMYILGVQNDELICYDVYETHTIHMSFSIYDNGIVWCGQNYDGEEDVYYTFTDDGKVHELLHFVRERSSDSDLSYDDYYLEGNQESRFKLRSDEEYESLVSSYQGEEPEWFDCGFFADIPQN